MSEAFEESGQELADADEQDSATIRAFGDDYDPPLARIDYGAYHQKNQDAEALCLVAQKSSYEIKGLELKCR